jgi:carboxyl-terminal processing protease
MAHYTARGLRMSLTRSNREMLLGKIQRLVQEKFYDATFKGKNWPEVVAVHRQRILESSTAEEFETEVQAMLKELNSPALGLLSDRTKVIPRNSINASFRSIDTSEGLRWVFQDVLPGGVAARAGVRPGDALISIAHQEIRPPQKPGFRMGESTTLVLSRNGKQTRIDLQLATPKPKYRENPYAEPESIQASMIENHIGHVKVSLFPGILGIDFANRLTAIFSSELTSADRLIIDLRGNPGGGIGGLRLMSYLTPRKQPVGYSLDRAMAESGYDRERLPRFGRIPSSKLEIPLLALKFAKKQSVLLMTEGLGSKRFHGKVVLLVNEHSTGAAEMVAQFARENQLGTIVGAKTPGRLVDRHSFKIGFGYRLIVPVAAYITWSGTQVEGNGITPDISVDWSYADALQGRDNQLEEAIAVAKAL